MSKACSWCGSTEHTSFYCKRKINKPPKRATKRIKRESDKTKAKRLAVNAEWDELNPPDAYGEWTCYLRISPLCFIKVKPGR